MKLILLLPVFVGIAIQSSDAKSVNGTKKFNESLAEYNTENHITDFGMDKEEVAALKAQLKKAEEEAKKNNANPNATSTEELNVMSDMEPSVIEKLLTGASPKTSEGRTYAKGLLISDRSRPWYRDSNNDQKKAEWYAYLDRSFPAAAANARKAYDPRDWFYTPVKNQGACASCTAFASAALFEAVIAKHYWNKGLNPSIPFGTGRTNLDVSEQYLLDCALSYRNEGNAHYSLANGCRGAWLESYALWLVNQGKGYATHTKYHPYRSSAGDCDTKNKPNNKECPRTKWYPGVQITDAFYDYETCNETRVKQLILATGGVLSGMYAKDSAFYQYEKGVIQDSRIHPGLGCTKHTAADMDHAIVIVGWGEQVAYKWVWGRRTAYTQKYWIVRNSWGKEWGENGYFKIERNSCAIGQVAGCVAVGIFKEGNLLKHAQQVPKSDKTNDSGTNMWCDMTRYSNTMNIRANDGWTQLRSAGGCLRELRCKLEYPRTMCTPWTPGPTNACQWICGKAAC